MCGSCYVNVSLPGIVIAIASGSVNISLPGTATVDLVKLATDCRAMVNHTNGSPVS